MRRGTKSTFNPLLFLMAAFALAVGLVVYGMLFYLIEIHTLARGLGFIVGGIVFCVTDIYVNRNLDFDTGFFRNFATGTNSKESCFPIGVTGLLSLPAALGYFLHLADHRASQSRVAFYRTPDEISLCFSSKLRRRHRRVGPTDLKCPFNQFVIPSDR